MSNLVHRVVADQLWFTAVNDMDSGDTFTIQAENEAEAKIKLLDMLGYQIVSQGGQFVLVDTDDPHDESKAELIFGATSMQEALTSCLKIGRWHLSEETVMLGGTLGAGFGEYEHNNAIK